MHALEYTESVIESPEFRAGRKLSAEVQTMFWQHCKQEPELPTQCLWVQVEAQCGTIQISLRYLNLIRQRWGFQRKKGRPGVPVATGQKTTILARIIHERIEEKKKRDLLAVILILMQKKTDLTYFRYNSPLPPLLPEPKLALLLCPDESCLTSPQ